MVYKTVDRKYGLTKQTTASAIFLISHWTLSSHCFSMGNCSAIFLILHCGLPGECAGRFSARAVSLISTGSILDDCKTIWGEPD